MSDAQRALETLAAAGVECRVNFEQLLLLPSTKVTPELKRLAVANKTGIIELLLTPKPSGMDGDDPGDTFNPRRGMAVEVVLDSGTRFKLIQPGGTQESIEHAINRAYGDRVVSVTAMEGTYAVLARRRNQNERGIDE